MTTKLEQLKTELREFIELSKTITQGEWDAQGIFVDQLKIDQCIASIETVEEDATFIARSRNISPKMAEMLLATIELMEDMPFSVKDTLEEKFLNLW